MVTNKKKSKKKLEAYLVGEYLNTEEFLTKKEKKSFEQVEKYVNKDREKTLQHMTKKRAERWDSENIDYNFVVDETTDWEKKIVNSELEMMIAAVNNNSKSNTNRSSVRTSLMYILYIIIIVGAIFILATQNGIL